MKQLVVVDASLSEAAASRRLAEHLLDRLQGEWEITHIELRHFAHAIVNNLLTGFPPSALAPAIQAVEKADAALVVTPTYQASYSGLLKMFLDVLPENSLAGTPVLLGATGGTPRHALMLDHALRPLLSYMHAVVAPTAVYAAAEDWGAAAGDSRGDGGTTLLSRLARATQELEILANTWYRSESTMVLAPESQQPPVESEGETPEAAGETIRPTSPVFERSKRDDFDNVTPFVEMLRKVGQ